MSIFQAILIPIIDILTFLIFITVILSWLVGFKVINLNNPTMRQIYFALEGVTSKILDPIRKVVPPISGLDFSPIIALIGLSVLRGLIAGTIYLF